MQQPVQRLGALLVGKRVQGNVHARLAQLPEAVLERAGDLLAEYESKKRVVQQSLGIVEMVKAPVKEQGVLDKLEMVDPNQLSPIQALQMIMDLQQELKEAQKA